MKYSKNDFIRFINNDDVYEVIDILTIKNVPGFNSDIFYNLIIVESGNHLVVEAKSIDESEYICIDLQYTREQKINNLIKNE